MHQDGLVHISQLSDRFVEDPNTVVKVGQIVQVKVVEVDVKRNRIQLTMKKDGQKPVFVDRSADSKTKAKPQMPEIKGAFADAFRRALK